MTNLIENEYACMTTTIFKNQTMYSTRDFDIVAVALYCIDIALDLGKGSQRPTISQ